MYFKVKSIEKVDYEGDIYCFEMKNQDEPYFTLPNGLITHNCRLRNEFTDNTFSYTLGAGGVATGSINVITLNMNRFVQNHAGSLEQDLHNALRKQIEFLHKCQYSYRKIMEKFQERGLLPIYDAGFISLDKQFLTIGVNGLVEAAEFAGISPTNNSRYIDWMGKMLKVIFDANKAGKEKYGVKFNTEFVPAENLGVKNAGWDRKDNYVVGRDCYNSYMYPSEAGEVNILDKFVLHGKQIVQYLDGGSALHLNLQEYLTKEQYRHLMKIAVRCGTNYFTTNVLVTVCRDCGHIDKQTHQSCTKCGGGNVDHATRVIGYLKCVSSFSRDRQIETGLRYKHESESLTIE